MMIDVNVDELKRGFWNHFPLAASIGAVLALELASVLLGGFRSVPAVAENPTGADQFSNTKALGQVLYTDFLYPLEIAAVILLVAIIAAIALTMRERKDTTAQSPGEPVKVKSSDRLRMVKMDPVHQAMVEPPAEEPKT
jgi:NADH-quinone oxidoreductase subunit J